MIKQKLDRFMAKRRCTLLGVGPMSKNCVDATIELANTHEVPIMMIASRRQIESAELGGGYVNNWSTEEFAKYVIEQDKKGKIVLARDHGGPWQNLLEVKEKYSLRAAMDSAKRSYRTDIESGFEIIHIDPSVDIHGTPSVDDVLERVFELYEYCWATAKRIDREIIFEIGTEEQSGTTNTLEELEYVLNETKRFCQQNGLPEPAFIVIQTGTRVMEMRNVGSFDSPYRIRGELPAEIQVPRMLDVCNRHRIFMKEHNTDYLSDEALAWHPKLGIHAANVAPEFGVAETKALFEVLRDNGLQHLADRFAMIAYESRKWEKWMIPGSKATDMDRSMSCGHYVFADSRFIELKTMAQTELLRKNIILDDYLKNCVKRSILRYMKNFRLLGLT